MRKTSSPKFRQQLGTGHNAAEEKAEGKYHNAREEQSERMPMFMQTGGYLPQTSAGQSVLKNALMAKMQSGAVSAPRFPVAPSQGNKPALKYIPAPDNRVYGDNTRYQAPTVDTQAIAKNQALIAQSKTVQGKSQLAAAKQRATESLAKNKEKQIDAEKTKQQGLADQRIAQNTGNSVGEIAGSFEKSADVQNEIGQMYDLDKVQQASRIRTGYDTDKYDASKLTKEQVDANYANAGNRLTLFGTQSPLVKAGLATPSSHSVVDSYLNPLSFAETAAASGMQGVEQSQSTGNIGYAMKGIGTGVGTVALGKAVGSKLHGLEHGLNKAATKAITSRAMPAMFAAGENELGQAFVSNIARGTTNASEQAIKQGVGATEHKLIHEVSPMYNEPEKVSTPIFKKGGMLKEMYTSRKMKSPTKLNKKRK